MAVTAKVDCRVCVISTVYETKQATLPRQNNQIHFGFGMDYIYYLENRLVQGKQRSAMPSPTGLTQLTFLIF